MAITFGKKCGVNRKAPHYCDPIYDNNKYHKLSKNNYPASFTDVLIFVDGTWQKGFWFRCDGLMMWKAGGKDYFPTVDNITHWTELPTPPWWCDNCMGINRGTQIKTQNNTAVCIVCGRDCEKDGKYFKRLYQKDRKEKEMSTIQERINNVKRLISEIEHHPMCVHLIEDPIYYLVQYPPGMCLDGSRSEKGGNKSAALERLLSAMDRHWAASGIML